jgi:DNA-directed RNA polymerase specialized sigma24 family protein
MSSASTFSEHEFKQLYFEYYPLVFKVALYILKDNTQAEDVAQDSFLKIWRGKSGVTTLK